MQWTYYSVSKHKRVKGTHTFYTERNVFHQVNEMIYEQNEAHLDQSADILSLTVIRA